MKIGLELLNLTTNVMAITAPVNNNQNIDFYEQNKVKNFALENNENYVSRSYIVSTWITDINIEMASKIKQKKYLFLHLPILFMAPLVFFPVVTRSKNKKYLWTYIGISSIIVIVGLTVPIALNEKYKGEINSLENYKNEYQKFYIAMETKKDAQFQNAIEQNLKQLTQKINQQFPNIINFEDYYKEERFSSYSNFDYYQTQVINSYKK
ncbi:hypothetical protein [Mesomycoplasma lagogenitalium]|uniref:Uncharacterized protein n=1 Tax=Mesomycoplasma lagogenitalium TaxID=171286 RepID=A0ABY8LTF4_9BACT|nr:hypothetical protein [Mesomycoplasma lagogenitalium]WGI36529.1 hypothetical protein QEG99_03630 [Mesomycoplasma lagogenitalium]